MNDDLTLLDDIRAAIRQRAAEAIWIGGRNHGGRPRKDGDK